MAKDKIKIARGVSISKDKAAKLRKKPGMSNLGEYKDVAKKDFAGPDGTYPIDTISRARSALKLAHNASNPAAIKAAVYRRFPQLKKDKTNDK